MGFRPLHDRVLVRRVEASRGEPRVGMLKTIREYAAERLDADVARADRVRRAHATWYTDLASRCRQDLVSTDRDDAVHQLGEEAENLRAAWRVWVAARWLAFWICSTRCRRESPASSERASMPV